MRQFNLYHEIPLSTSIDYCQVLIYRKNKHKLGVVNDRMWIGHSIISGHRMSPSHQSLRRDRTIMPNTIFIWDGITRQGWLQSSTAWTLRSNWVSQYRIPRSLRMSSHMYHTYTRMLERLAFNQKLFLSYLHNLWYEIKKYIYRYFI
jgi:hypothetical protein